MGGLVARSSKERIDRASAPGRSSLEDGESLTFPLRRDGSETLQRQVARRLRQAISDGRLRPGVRLPGTRGLARELGIARITVQTAYDQLAAEGYIEVDGRRGTRVSIALPAHGFRAPDPPGVPDPVRFPPLARWASGEPVTSPAPARAAGTELGPEWFGLGSVDARGWERLLVRAWRELATEPDGALATYAGPFGDDRLRIALADHLAVARGVRCTADDIALTAGSIAAVGAIVVEDDCESELRYDGAPLPSLQGLAPDGRVIYASTFSKVLFPGIRTGYVVVPPVHRGPFLAALEAGARQPGAVEQRALALFLEAGGFQRHVRRLRSIYASRRDAFIHGLGEASGLEVRRASAGGHLILGVVDPRWTATALSSALAEVGVRVEPLSANRLLPAKDDELVVYLSRPDASELTAAARVIARVIARRPKIPAGQSSAARRRRTAGSIPPAT